MTKSFYKHKLLLDENLYYRRLYPQLNQHFDVKHIKGDLRQGSMDDQGVYAIAIQQGRILLTKNVKDFRPLLTDDSPGIIGLPEGWSAKQTDTKLTALLIKHSANYFKGKYHSLAAE